MRKLTMFVLLLSFLLPACTQPAFADYSLPDECGGKCEFAEDLDSFRDALINSSAAFSNCICLESGTFNGMVTLAKPLRLIGRKDGSSFMRNLIVSNSSEVLLRDFSFKDVPADSAALYISGSSVVIDNVSISGISASSVSGGRGIIISGGKSDVTIKNSKIEKTDGTGLLINGGHDVSLENVKINGCGFAGIWVQNQNEKSGSLSVEKSEVSGSGAVSIEILGNSVLKVSDSVFRDVKKREMGFESVGDGIVVKSRLLAEENVVSVVDSEISGFPRAGIILDGSDSGESSVNAFFDNVSLFSDKGSFGLVVQNASETADLRDGIKNDFGMNDEKREYDLFIIDTLADL